METLLKKEVITTGKTIDEAIANAVSELGAPSVESIEYTVLFFLSLEIVIELHWRSGNS